MKDLENLQENGINIKDEDGNEIVIMANLIVATGDLPPVASILERNSDTSLHPCSFCNAELEQFEVLNKKDSKSKKVKKLFF
ncbi:hypothetical protein C6P40_002632 [Pichia californica]|uniref:Uncharacterized protein n=1 Tax=Pichia californica TaxID=460514 RepID=A0A9P6WHZ3_9ASCO|nr:hypothetical protein C6P40_002632 [[Candida] californica]